MELSDNHFKKSRFRKSRAGFTLIELAVVLVIVGIVISIVATVLPSLIQSAKIKKAQALLEKMDYAVQGYALANHRLPFADGDGDGQEDSGAYFGTVPYRTLGISSGDDAWGNAVRYGVYDTLTAAFADGNAFCTAISSASISSFDSGKAFTTSADHLSGAGPSNSSNQAYVLASGGPKDLDGANGFFDLGNGEGSAGTPGFNAPGKIQSPTYDDLIRAFSLNELNQKNCSGGGGGGGGPPPTGVENTNVLCSDGIDNDGDGYIDCFDQDCCGAGLTVCAQCPPQANVQINAGPMAGGTVGGTYTHTFQATGGSGYYFWYLDGITPNIPGLTISLWNGTLSGTIGNCAGNYSVDVRVEDRYDSAKTNSRTFTLAVTNGTLTVSPSPGGGGPGNPDFTVDNSIFSEVFTAGGDHAGDFHWTINWQGVDPGGFQIVDQSGIEGRFWKSGGTRVGSYSFTLTVSDSTCPTNTYITNPYTITITPAGIVAPYSADLVGEWRFDECSWNGTAGEVEDSGNKGLDGTAVGNADTVGAGHLCRAGEFDGSGDYVRVDSTNDLKRTTPFSISLWVKVYNTPPSWARLVGKGDSTNRNYGVWLRSNGQILFQIYADGGTGSLYGSRTVNDGNWHHVVCVYDLATMKVYIDNGTPSSLNYTQVPRISDDPLTIGGTDWGNYFDGLLDEIMLFGKALPPDSATETSVKTIYELSRPSCTGSCYSGPVAEYRMENFPWTGAAGEVVDSGAGGSNGVAAAFGTGSLPTQTAPSGGKVCRAGVFTRVDANNGGYLDLGDPADGDLDPGAAPWTASAWIRWDGSPGDNIIFNKENLYEARVNGGYVQFAWMPHWTWDGGTSLPVTADTWAYVTIVYDGHQQALYKNAKQVFTRNQTGAIGTNGSRLLIGARGSLSPHDFFGGQIDEVRFYNRALAENEIQADMDETRDCSADSVVITTTTLPQGTINSPYDTILSATGGTTPYGWEIVSPNPLPGVSIVSNIGELHGTTNACAGEYNLTFRVTDAASRLDERILTLTLANGTLAVSPASPRTFTCSNSSFSQDFTVSGPRLGLVGNWQIQWLGTNPGGFEIISSGDDTARFRKSSTSTPGSGYQFKLTASDSACPGNQADSGFYTLDISGGGAEAP